MDSYPGDYGFLYSANQVEKNRSAVVILMAQLGEDNGCTNPRHGLLLKMTNAFQHILPSGNQTSIFFDDFALGKPPLPDVPVLTEGPKGNPDFTIHLHSVLKNWSVFQCDLYVYIALSHQKVIILMPKSVFRMLVRWCFPHGFQVSHCSSITGCYIPNRLRNIFPTRKDIDTWVDAPTVWCRL